jgi:hypothetical protein
MSHQPFTIKGLSNVGSLKGPKLEIFGSGIFTQIRPVRVGDLGTKPKNSKVYGFGLKIAADSAKKVPKYKDTQKYKARV